MWCGISRRRHFGQVHRCWSLHKVANKLSASGERRTLISECNPRTTARCCGNMRKMIPTRRFVDPIGQAGSKLGKVFRKGGSRGTGKRCRVASSHEGNCARTLEHEERPKVWQCRVLASARKNACLVASFYDCACDRKIACPSPSACLADTKTDTKRVKRG